MSRPDQTAINVPNSNTPLLADKSSDDRITLTPPRILFLIATTLLVIGLVVAIVACIHNNEPLPDDRSLCSSSVNPLVVRGVDMVARGVKEGVSAKSNHPLLGLPACIWTKRMLNWQRTGFHFQPVKNWINDPNGPLFYKGWYHLFYQYNPEGAVWGNIIWGHAVSKDLMNWRHLPYAMVMDQWYDAVGVWTGSATILPDGQLIMLYTGATEEWVQVQNLAYPADPSDPLLIDWVKYDGNPVLVPPPGTHPRDFRDPTTAWMTSEGKWRITIGSKINNTKTGISLVYDTEDFKTFELQNGLLHATNGTGMWECVDFYPVSKTEQIGLDTSINGPEVKHVMKASMDDDRNDYYTLGTYNEASASYVPDNIELDLGYGLRYDYGVFYASKTFYDQNKKRRLLWGWIKETDSEVADVLKGWASLMNVPRTVLLDRKTGNNLLLWPVEEVEHLRKSKTQFDKVEAKPGSVVPLDVGEANQLDIEAEFEINGEALKGIKASNEPYNCSTSGGSAQRGALGPFGLLVLSDKDLKEQTPIYFYITKQTDGNYNTNFCADQTRSSIAADVFKPIYGSQVSVIKDERLTMRILVDHSIVESFAQQGRSCITSRIYPSKAINRDAKLFLFNNATDVSITASIKVWQMSTAQVDF